MIGKIVRRSDDYVLEEFCLFEKEEERKWILQASPVGINENEDYVWTGWEVPKLFSFGSKRNEVKRRSFLLKLFLEKSLF